MDNIEQRIKDLEEKNEALIIQAKNIKKENKRLRRRRKHFEDLFHHAPVAYQSLTSKGILADVNNTWLTYLGYDTKEIIGTPFSNILTEEYKEKFIEKFPIFKEIGKMHNIEYELIKKDGSTIYTIFNGIIMYDSKNNFKKSHCVFMDITARKIAESENYFKNISDVNGIIPMCAACKDVRDKNENWHPIETILEKMNINISHGMCLDCMKKYYPEHYK